jgi:Flp pilus assembly protein TadD
VNATRRRIVARFVFIACTALLGFSSSAYAGGGVYQRTKGGHTIVWNNYPRPGDEASWSGGKDGQGYATGDGTLTWYTRGVLGSRYTGRMIRGKLNGPVTNVDANGGTFRGTFVNGSKSADWAEGTDKGESTERAPAEEGKQAEERSPQAEAQAAEERNQQAQTKVEKERPKAEAVAIPSDFDANTISAPSKAELAAMYDKAFRAFNANNFTDALKELDAIDAGQPDLAESQNLRGVIMMREGIYGKAEAAMHEALRIEPKFWNAHFNLAEIPFLKKDWAEARNRFQDLLSSNATELQGEATQLIQYKILLTYLLEGKESMVDSMLAKLELSPDTPAFHYANAAIALQRNNTSEAKDWMAQAEKNFSPQLNKLFVESFYEIGWLKRAAR